MLPSGYQDAESEGVPYDNQGGSLYTNEADAVVRFIYRVTDPTKFSPLFTVSLSWFLAGYLSGPIVKDPTGRTQTALFQRAEVELGKAAGSAANSAGARAVYVPTAKRVR